MENVRAEITSVAAKLNEKLELPVGEVYYPNNLLKDCMVLMEALSYENGLPTAQIRNWLPQALKNG